MTINREFGSIEEFINEYATDISLSGCFIRSRQPLPRGTLVGLHFTVLDSDVAIIEGQGEVVRVVPPPAENAGMGVRFTQLTPDSRSSIRRLFEATGRPVEELDLEDLEEIEEIEEIDDEGDEKA